MKNKRREFLKHSALTGLGIAGGGVWNGFASGLEDHNKSSFMSSITSAADDKGTSIIGQYGSWAASLIEGKLPSLSFRNKEWSSLESWRASAKKRLTERLAIPEIGGIPDVQIRKQSTFDGLQIEELSWQLPYGRPTEAILLKPINQKGPLPGILAFHDHGGNKYFGTRKITHTAVQHPQMEAHQKEYYEGFAWANEIAKRGYVVLVSDAHPFASRRVMMQDVPEHMRNGLTDQDPEDPKNISA